MPEEMDGVKKKQKPRLRFKPPPLYVLEREGEQQARARHELFSFEMKIVRLAGRIRIDAWSQHFTSP